MPVPVSMQGTVAFSTQARIRPAPPRGMRRSTRPLAVISSCAEAWLVSSTMFTMSGVAARLRNARLERSDNGAGAAVGFLSAAEHADVAALDGKRRSVGGDVGAALVNDGDEAERHLHLVDDDAVGAHDLAENAARMVGKPDGVADAVRHAGDAVFIELAAGRA